ncbi:hypothetical protein [Enterocloster lavalensis]|uniref:hypothetical protein n=1 Tax=Enterocloster lavalensis TaxID=460384 RepID=UPI0034A1C438
MFLKTGELKKIMKASLKKHGLIVGNVDDHYLVYSDCWGAYVEHPYASNKFKAAIMELIGDLPEPGECYHYTIGADKELVQEAVIDYPDPYEDWKRAKDFAAITPMFLMAWPHEYLVFQRHSDLAFLTAERKLSCDVISASELDHTAEGMPGRPSMLYSVLYFKNETTIYWVHTESPGTKAREVLFPHMNGISFFEDDWIAENVNQEEEELTDLEEEAAEEPLPY